MNLNKCLLLLAVPSILSAQNVRNAQNVQVIPSSPVSAAFERYGDYPVSMFTGVPEINIPLYEIVSGDLTLPISISYHASGVKMSDASYPVGLGWSLNAGGRISRTVRGKPDDQYPSLGTLPLSSSPFEVNAAMKNSHDPEPDLFFYDTGNGQTGRFLFDGITKHQNNGVFADPIFFPHNNYKFAYSQSAGVISLIDEAGQAFKFGGAAKAETGIIDAVHPTYTSAWLLSEILPTSKQVSDKITFNYAPGPDISTCTNEGTLSIIDSISWGSGNNMNPYLPQFDHLFGLAAAGGGYYNNPAASMRRITDDGNLLTYVSNVTEGTNGNYTRFYGQECHSYETSNITRIEFKGGAIEFTYDASGKFLDQIKVLNTQNELIRKIEFYHSRYSNCSWNHYKLDRLVIRGNDPADPPQEYKFEYESGVWENTLLAKDHWGYFNGAISNTTPIPRWVDIPTLALSKYVNGLPAHTYMNTDIGTAERGVNLDYMKRYSLKKMHFPTKGHTEFTFEANEYYSAEEQSVKQAGGLRIAKIKSYDGMGKALIKEYKYGIDNTGVGIPANIPTYQDYVMERHLRHTHFWGACGEQNNSSCYWLGPDVLYARRRDFSSSPNKELFYTEGSSVWYNHVEERITNDNGESIGKTSYAYEFPALKEEMNYYTNDQRKLSTRYTLFFKGFNQPRLKLKTTFRSQGGSYAPLQSVQYDYTLKSTGPYTAYTYPYYKWLTYNEEIPPSLIDDPFYDFQNIGEILTTSGEIVSETYKIEKEIISDYDPNQASHPITLVTTRNYAYESDRHMFPTRIESTNSRNESRIERVSYPLDYINLTGQDDLTRGIKKLQEENLVSVPIESTVELNDENMVNNGVISGKIVTYKPDRPFADRTYIAALDRPVTSFARSAVSGGSVTMDPSYEERIQVDLYNDEGDVLEQHSPNDIHEAYLWGYNNTYPVAKIAGADYHTAYNILSQASKDALLNPSGDQQVRDVIQQIRNHASMANAMVTTYTYDPLIGMTSETDPNNKTTYYEYDSLGRLKLIRDAGNNIVKMFEYNYQIR